MEHREPSSQDRLLYCLLRVPTPMLLFDETERIVMLNQPWLSLSGYTREELQTLEDWTRRAYREDSTETLSFIRSIIQEKPSRKLSERDVFTKGGQLRRWSFVASFVGPSADGHQLFLCMAHDVTEQKLAAEQLQELNQSLEQRVAKNIQEIRLLAEAVSHLGEGVMITSDELDWPGPKIVFVNEAMCQMAGYTAEEMLGNTPRIMQGPKTNRQELDRLRKELARGRSCVVELVNYRKDGSAYDTELFITPIYNAEGKRTHFVSVQRDISDRKSAERMLYRAQFAIDHSHDAIFWVGPDGHLLFVNEAACKLSGYQHQDLLTKHVSEFDVEMTAAEWPQWWERIKTEGSATLERRFLGKDGQEFPVEVSPNYVRYEREEFLCAFVRNISHRKQAEAELRNRGERLTAILNTAADAIINIDHRGIITEVNPATERMFGYPNEELIGQNVKILMPSPYHEEHDEYIANYLHSRNPRIIGTGREVMGRRKDGSTFPIGLAVSEVDHLNLFTGIVRDISAVKQLQKEVLEIAAEEDRRIGHELHEGIQQEVTALELFAGSLAHALDGLAGEEVDGTLIRRLDEAQFQAIRQMTQKLCAGLAQTHSHVQQLSRGIMPVQIDAQGLNSALAELASATDSAHDISCRFDSPEIIEVTDNSTATHLFRIAQEAITNAVRHSNCNEIRISLNSYHDQLLLEVTDNGIGIDPAISSRAQGRGIGIGAMHYRAGLIGAMLHIGRREEGGTRVTCTVLRPSP